jgi:hypothetical protein
MTLCIYVHSRLKRAKTVALLDLGATENFINISYAQKLNLPIQRLTQERRLFNIDRTPNKAGTLKYYSAGQQNMTIFFKDVFLLVKSK